MVRSDTVLLDGSGGTHPDALRGTQSADAMLVFSVAPYSRVSIDAARYAAARRATIVAVTDSVVSPLAALTRHVLLVGTDTPAMFKSVVPSMAVSQVLAAQILAQGGQEALERKSVV